MIWITVTSDQTNAEVTKAIKVRWGLIEGRMLTKALVA